MREMVQKNDDSVRAVPTVGQTHDLRSFWNYFFDFGSETMDSLQPKINVTEEKNSVLVTAEIPGVKEDNLDLRISDDGYLTISGEKACEKEHQSANTYFNEISYGTFKRTIPLPMDLDYNMAEADYAEGVLSVTIPKSKEEKQKYKKISVKKKVTTPKNLQA